ncbi:MAG: hypothetical protein FJZ00_14365, partial [Candidatus Sericytochromatia bacterium]|nr:hypothetical protein [Candidatus Tanganyikabacteria bacterium]
MSDSRGDVSPACADVSPARADVSPVRAARDTTYDACALLAHVSPDAGRAGLDRVLAGLRAMEHRCGQVAGETDGVGVHVDLPRALWADRVGSAAYAADFAVAHLFLAPEGAPRLLARVIAHLRSAGFDVLTRVVGAVRSEAPGPVAARREPV